MAPRSRHAFEQRHDRPLIADAAQDEAGEPSDPGIPRYRLNQRIHRRGADSGQEEIDCGSPDLHRVVRAYRARQALR